MQCKSEFGQLQLRTDCGTKNGTMAAIHCALRSQHTDDLSRSPPQSCMALLLQTNKSKVDGVLESKGAGLLRLIISFIE